MNNTDLPLPPPPGASGPEVCNRIRLYMAVARDLSPERLRALNEHLRFCRQCAEEYRLIHRTTSMVAGLEESTPSARVDREVMAAITAYQRARHSGTLQVTPQRLRPLVLQQRPGRRGRRGWLAGSLAAAAVLLIAILTSVFFLNTPQQAFAVPANVSWSGYALYHTQSMMSADGHPYEVKTYHNLASDILHVETVMGEGKESMDIVVMKDPQKTLGMDVKKHVAQWDVKGWVDEDAESVFDLDQLRKDLQTGQAVYLGKDHFNGQEVYKIRCPSGLVLLLDMQYRPVNLLDKAEKPLYNTFHVMSLSQVSPSMWNMDWPAEYKPGKLPAAPQPATKQ
ncbi:MAG: hypothetical protein IMW89_18645 [Ktedonobacteraceae bacterium]|nr:hypothetical protein [Ktedonobacteraceae bacterium]